jgi:hypothetical protein
LKLRAGLGVAALGAGLAGMAWEFRPLVWMAIALLVPAVLLRFLDRPRRRG